MSKPANYNEQLDYYKNRYDEVRVVSCDKCGSPLAFEVKGGVDGAGNPTHHEGFDVIPVTYGEHPHGMALMSWRARLDGEMGYQCGQVLKNPKYAAAVKEHKQKFNDTIMAMYKEAVKGVPKKNRAPEPRIEDWPEPVSELEYMYCGNNTLLASIERMRVPANNATAPGQAPTMSPFDREKLRDEIASSGNKPDVEVKGNIKRVETFKIERIK